ncbi:Saccharopine dehydrogenase [Hypoxylon sp. FL1857]|nr:Saccharopine dehydrogenase [Hypoxylon sp. FL1857]
MSALLDERRKTQKYDILFLGATGYTGSLTAEHIVRRPPNNLKWAIAGRSTSKLEALARKLKDLGPVHLQPEIEVVSFEDRRHLDLVVKDSRVCVSVVLYWQVGEVVVQPCVENGTDYIDVAGGIPVLRTFVKKYHDVAVKAGVAVGAFGSGFVRELARKTSRKTREMIMSVAEIELSASGGTISSLMAENTYGPRAIEQARQPWVLSPVEAV